MITHPPPPCPVRELLTDLLGRDVELSPGAPLAPGPATPATIASYVDDSLQLAALVVCDLPMSAHAGAALRLVPPDQALAALPHRPPPHALAENPHQRHNPAPTALHLATPPHPP